jgi:DNA-binding NarL/FixJ family response regulator
VTKRILIADDHESVLRTIRAKLESHLGWQVCGDAVDGRETVKKAIELKPDLVVLDFAMPELNGLMAASEIKELLPEMPIVMYTMYGSPEVEREAKKHGISRLVEKAKSAALVVAIEELLGSTFEGTSGLPAPI